MIVLLCLGGCSPRKTETAGGDKIIVTMLYAGDLPFAVTEDFRRIDWEADKPPDIETAENKTYNFRGKHILHAEDNELNREIAVELLGTVTDAAIDEAEDGQKAVALFAESEINYYDLILMDIQMPRL